MPAKYGGERYAYAYLMAAGEAMHVTQACPVGEHRGHHNSAVRKCRARQHTPCQSPSLYVGAHTCVPALVWLLAQT